MHQVLVRGLRRLPAPVKKVLKRLPLLDAAARRAYGAAGPRPVRVEPGGFLLHLDLRSPTQRAYATSAPAEGYVARHLAEVLSPGDHVVDVGGYVGYFTMLAAGIVGAGGSVTAFEPVPENAASIRRSAAANGFGHVQVEEVAVSDHEGRDPLWVDREEGGSASSTSSLAGGGSEQVEVPVTTLDRYVAERGLARVDLVKIDVEGLEEEVVRGMEAVMRDLRPELVVEFAGPEAAKACVALLEARSYRTVELGRTRHGIHVSATPAPR
ncbi:MAG TPA: FkbM family methyltransferase [Actinomycetota bacterium]|nr:FkbM family methyltransferase [Actinomycetota bacterium]